MASAAGPGNTLAANVWSFSRTLVASINDCPFISDFVPVTVIFSPLRTAVAICPPSPGDRSTTLPFCRYRLRASPPVPALKARTREDWVTTGSSKPGESAVGALGGAMGDVGAAGAGPCANATELNAIPRAVIFRKDGVCIDNTSTRCRASRVPFLETAEVLR